MALGFFTGVGYHLQAARLLAHTPRLWRFIGLPVAVGALAGLGLYLAGATVGWAAVGMLMEHLPEWAIAIGWLLRVLILAALLYLTGFLVAKFGVILGSPWYGQLAEEIERMHLPVDEIPEAPQGLVAISQDIGLAALYELKKLAFVVAIAPPLLVVTLIPVAGPVIATFGWICVGVTTLVLDFIDPALQRRRLRFRDKLRLVTGAPGVSAGFGGVALVLVGIPIVNFFAVPLCMTAGTLLYCDRLHAKLNSVSLETARG